MKPSKATAETFSKQKKELDVLVNQQGSQANEDTSRFFTSISELSNVNENLSQNLFIFLFITFTVSLLGLHIIIKWFGTNIASQIFSSNSLLHVFTVFVLVTAIVILAMSGHLAQEQLSTLIAAISGYVLGQLGRSEPPQAPEPPKLS